uniref:Uncharacterized protein n=1 Tax=Opuntia streptacantha TaxID=393608 RepID=A0A7C9E4N5_OPUST
MFQLAASNERMQERMLGCSVTLRFTTLIGHITPMLHLGNVLHSEGFSITIVHTHFNSLDPSIFPNFPFCYIEDAPSEAELPPSEAFDTVVYLNTSCWDPFQDCLSEIMVDASEGKEPVACLILNCMWHFATTTAEAFDLPRIALRTSGILAFVLYDALPLLPEKGYFPLQGTAELLLIRQKILVSFHYQPHRYLGFLFCDLARLRKSFQPCFS